MVGNIDQPNRIHFGDGSGGFTDEITFGKSDRYTYAVAVTDLDLDGDSDVITAVVGGPNVAYINGGQVENLVNLFLAKRMPRPMDFASGITMAMVSQM